MHTLPTPHDTFFSRCQASGTGVEAQASHPLRPAALHALHLPLGLAAGGGLALVVVLASAGQSDLDLRESVREVHGERHEGEARFVHPLGEVRDLGALQEQGAGPAGLMTVDFL